MLWDGYRAWQAEERRTERPTARRSDGRSREDGLPVTGSAVETAQRGPERDKHHQMDAFLFVSE